MALAILCSGQGGQHAAMFDVVADDPRGRATLDAASAAAGFDLRAAATAPTRFDNAIAQPLVSAAALAAWSALAPRLAERRVAPRVFAGYSVGELAAYGCAGALAVDVVVRLAGRRAAAMDAASAPGDGLVALRGIGGRALAALAATHAVDVAIVNGEDQVLVGGAADGLAAIAADAAARGIGVQRLPVAVAAHTPLLADAAVRFRADLAAAPWNAIATPVVAGIDGAPVQDPASAVDTLARQTASTIHWSAVMDSVRERGARVCLELGPGTALARMMRERHRDVAARSIEDFRRLDAVADWIVGALG